MTFIIICAAAVGVLAAAVAAVTAVRRFLISVNRSVRNVSGLLTQIEKVTDDNMHTPKSLSNCESVMLIRIQRDFPEFNVQIARQVVNGTISKYFAVLNDRRGASGLRDTCTDAFVSETEGQIVTNQTRYEDVKIHKTVISDYRRSNEEAVITFQSAIQYRYNDKALMQFVYETHYAYYLSENDAGENVSLICSNCGAEIDTLGVKICEYCGAEIMASVERTWKINKILRTR